MTPVMMVSRVWSLWARSIACASAWSASGEPSTATRMLWNMIVSSLARITEKLVDNLLQDDILCQYESGPSGRGIISTQLPAQIGLLTRLLTKEFGERYSYTEARLLGTLTMGPRRIGELAELEGLAQPTTTLLVKRLEERGLVRRERQADDQRVVLVSLTDAGRPRSTTSAPWPPLGCADTSTRCPTAS